MRRKLGLTAWVYIVSILVNLGLSSAFILLYFRPAFEESNAVFQEQQRLEYVRSLVRLRRAGARQDTPNPTSELPRNFEWLFSARPEITAGLTAADLQSADKLDLLEEKLARGIDALGSRRQESLARASESQQWLTRLLALNSIAGIVLCGTGLLLVRRWVVQPASVLKAAAIRIREGDFNSRIALAAKDEMGKLGREMSLMARQIERLQQQLLHRERIAAADQMIEKVEHHVQRPLARVLELAGDSAKRNAGEPELAASQKRIAATVLQFQSWLAQLRRGLTCTASEPQEIELAAIVASVVRAVQPALDEHRVQLITHTDPAIQTVRTDGLQLEQALISLVTNAIQASVADQTVGLSASMCEQAPDYWQIEITDQGSGIAPELMDKIFQPFFTTKTDGNGIGLGLVKSIVHLHGGELSVSSVVGQGSCFRIRMPLHPQDSPGPRSQPTGENC